MDKSITHNKMIVPDNETKIKFNMDLHGFRKGQIIKLKSVPYAKQILIHRRLMDAKIDGCVEVVNDAPKVIAEPTQIGSQSKTEQSNLTGKKGSKNNKKEDK